MGHEWLETLAALLTAAGIRAGEDFPAGGMPRISGPVAALGIKSLDSGQGCAELSVRVLSPRSLGGWSCQSAGVKAAAALAAGGIRCRSGAMEYQSGSDCFCVEITATMAVHPEDGGWAAGSGWTYLCGNEELEGVESFTAREDRDRRLVGAFCQGEPVAISPGVTGWELTLVQRLGPEDQEPEEPAEPFTLTVQSAGGSVVYTGCGWDRIQLSHSQQALVVERRGFALGREVNGNG